MPNTVAIVQAHTASTRFPEKVLMDIKGEPVLAHVVNRIRQCSEIDDVIVATSRIKLDDRVVSICDSLDCKYFRGSENDVLDRFTEAARIASADICVRITSDCPLIDPGVSADIIRRFKAADPAVDYASNKIPQSFPRGLDTEVFTFSVLQRVWALARETYQRLHVTCYLYEHPELFRLLSITSAVDRADWRWTLDTPEDFEFIRAVYRSFDTNDFSWTDVLALLRQEPRLQDINRHIRQKEVIEG